MLDTTSPMISTVPVGWGLMGFCWYASVLGTVIATGWTSGNRKDAIRDAESFLKDITRSTQ